jgi:hypothetical protein
VKYSGPAGSIGNALELRYSNLSCADAGTTNEQYAENIGMLRRTVQTIAGPRDYNLVAARVGKSSIETLANGRFTVSADVAPDAINVTLRISIGPGNTLVLPFPTGQYYDLALIDDSGTAVYRWSADKIFMQALRQLTVTDEWTATVPIPRPAAGNYTLRAWMTTSDDVPPYAAIVVLTVPTAK